MKTIKDSDILEHITTLDNDGLDEIIELVKIRRSHLTALARRKLDEGTEVEFDARGKTWTGKVTKVNRKTVKVSARPDGEIRWTNWKVSIDLLRF